MKSSIKIGSAWSKKESGDCVIVVAAERTGHQYDRYWLIEVMTDAGNIQRIEDWNLMSQYEMIKSAKELHD